jgi:hypothetical protein
MTLPDTAGIGSLPAAPGRRWQTTDTKALALAIALGVVCGIVSLIYARDILLAFGSNTSEAHGDFFALWSYGKIAAAHSATDLYSFATVHERQVALGMTASSQNPFPYPPTAILLFLPLSLASYPVAYILWELVTFSLFLWVVVGTCWRTPRVVLPVIIAPLTVVGIDSGQSGFLSGALLIGGLRLAKNRPVISGILIGLLSFKPQLGLLVPVALVAAGLWRPVAVACLTIVLLAATTTICFGANVWPAWLHMLPIYSRWFAHSQIVLQYMLTVEAYFRMLGISPDVADAAQAVSAFGMAVIVWRCFRRGPSEQATAALLVATFLCTPHALIYDAPMLTGALVLFVATRVRAGTGFSLTEVAVLASSALFPIVMVLKHHHIPIASPVLFALLALIVRDLFATVPEEHRPASPSWPWPGLGAAAPP